MSLRSRVLFFIFSLFTAFLITSCFGGGGGNNNDTLPDITPDNGGGIVTIPEAMFLIMDDDENPLENALVGGDELSDNGGIASGSVQKSVTGWVSVSAFGYADSFTHSAFLPDLIPAELYLALLTQFHDMAILNSGQQTTLNANGNIIVNIDSNQLSTLPAQIGVAEINPNTIGPLFENLNPQQDLNLQAAFAVQAMDLSLNPVSITTDNTLTITLDDGQGVTPPPVLAYFDPESGLWQVIENACSRTGSNILSCEVDRFSPLFGLFTADPVTYLAAKSLPSAVSSTNTKISPVNNYKLGDSNDSSSSILAYNRVRNRLNQMASDGNFDADDPELNDALDNLMNEAMDYARTNRNEKGKAGLLSAAEAVILGGGNEASANDAISEAKKISNEMGENLLNEDCSRYREIMHVAEQNVMLDNGSMADKLMDKLKNELSECDVWTGTITYWMRVSETHPLDRLTLVSGGGLWKENHKVRITTDPQTYESHGEDTLNINFQNVKYEDVSNNCEQSITYSANGQVILEFDGSYDGYTFSMGDVGLAGGSSSVSLTQKQVMEDEDSDGNCVAVPSFPLNLEFPHFSFLAHGVSSPSPPLTIQEILDSGAGQQEHFGGDDSFTNGQIDLGTYPFSTGTIIWSFYHVQKILPIED